MLESTRSKDTIMKTQNPAIKMFPGFVAMVRIRCGRANCRCARGARHIAHYHVSYNGGRRFRRYVRRADVVATRSACQFYKDVQIQLRAGRSEYKQNLAKLRELLKTLS